MGDIREGFEPETLAPPICDGRISEAYCSCGWILSVEPVACTSIIGDMLCPCNKLYIRFRSCRFVSLDKECP
jgi:hypothetical protein